MSDRPPSDLEAKYRKLHESMTDAFVSVSMDGWITESNRAYQELTGYTAEELSKLTYVDLTPAKWHDMEARIVAEQIIPLGHSEVYEKEYRRKDGSLVPIELRTFLIDDADGQPSVMWAIIRDITERKRLLTELREANEALEERVRERTSELRESLARFRTLADAAWEGIALSENGIAVDVNPRLAEMFDWSHSELDGKPVSDLVAPASRELVAEKIQSDHEGAYQFAALKKDGTVFPVEVRARMMFLDGRKLRVSVFRDLTESHRLRAKLASQRKALERAQHQSLLGEVGASIAHQIAQPLCALRNNVSAAMRTSSNCPVENGNANDALLDIDADLKRISTMVDSLRQLAKPELQQREPLALNDVVRQVIRVFGPSVESGRIEMVAKLQQDLPPLPMDQVQISQMVLNLLQNAVDSCSSKDAVITITTNRPAPDIVELSVSDTGPGIDPEILPQIFDFLFTDKPDGTGIGLSLCKRIITAHGGTIEAANHDGRSGATFRVQLPLFNNPS